MTLISPRTLHTCGQLPGTARFRCSLFLTLTTRQRSSRSSGPRSLFSIPTSPRSPLAGGASCWCSQPLRHCSARTAVKAQWPTLRPTTLSSSRLFQKLPELSHSRVPRRTPPQVPCCSRRGCVVRRGPCWSCRSGFVTRPLRSRGTATHSSVPARPSTARSGLSATRQTTGTSLSARPSSRSSRTWTCTQFPDGAGPRCAENQDYPRDCLRLESSAAVAASYQLDGP